MALLHFQSDRHGDFFTNEPQITFFKSVFRRFTNFAIEAVPQQFLPKPTFGMKNCRVSINRHTGDLLYKLYLEIKVKNTGDGNVNLQPFFAYRLLKNVTLRVGSTTIDSYDGETLKRIHDLQTDFNKKILLNEMTGGGNGETQLIIDEGEEMVFFVPLEFYFCNSPGSALPLRALSFSDIELLVTLEDEVTAGVSDGTLNIVDFHLYCDYIFLTSSEAQRIGNTTHEYIATQTRINMNTDNMSGDNKIRLPFQGLVRELIWFIRENNKPFSELRDMKGANIIINSNPRTSMRPGAYYRLVQPYQHHTGHSYSLHEIYNLISHSSGYTNVNKNVFSFSFALHPENVQPSGFLSFNNKDIMLNFEMDDNVITKSQGLCIRIIAIIYNIVRIESGQLALLFNQ